MPGLRNRASGHVVAAPVEFTDARTLTTAIYEVTKNGATVYTDGRRGYSPLASLGFAHAAGTGTRTATSRRGRCSSATTPAPITR